RGAPRSFSAATEEAAPEAIVEEETPAEVDAGSTEPPLGPPPAQLGAAMNEDEPASVAPTPAAPPSSFGGSRFGDSRFSAPPPANALPSEPAAAALAETRATIDDAAPTAASGYGAPAPRSFGTPDAGRNY